MKAPGPVAQRFLIFDFHGNRMSGPDIGHRICEDVGSLLLDEGCAPPRFLRVLINPFCFGAFLDFSLDDSLANPHTHAIHRGGFRQGKYINSLDPSIDRILELLAHAHAGHHSGDPHVDIRGHRGGRQVGAGVRRLEEEAAGPHVAQGEGLAGPGCGAGGCALGFRHRLSHGDE